MASMRHTPEYTQYLTQPDTWTQLLTRLPDDLEQTVLRYGAILRKREVKSAAQFLRLIFAYACNLPLAVVAGWATACGLARLSDQALDTRIRYAAAWLQALLGQVLALRAGLPGGLPLTVRIADGTQVTRPGATGPDWRLHLTIDLQRQRVDAVTLTDAHGAEGFAHSEVQAGQVVLGDRGFGTRANILATHRAGAFALVRIAWNTFPLCHPEGPRFDLLAALATVAPGTVASWAVQMAPSRRSDPVVHGRLVVSRLPAADAARARDRAQHRHRKTAKRNAHGQQATLQPATLLAAEFLILFTTLPASRATEAQLVALYRLRWQIELAIKRLKSILGLAHLTARHPALCRAVLLAKLLLVVLVDDLCADAEAFSPSAPHRAARASAQPVELAAPRLGNRADSRAPRLAPRRLGHPAA